MPIINTICAKRDKNFQQKGFSLLLIILILNIVLASSLAISFVIGQEIKFARDVGDSTLAFFAADSGMERELYIRNYSMGDPVNRSGVLTNGSIYDVTVTTGPLNTIIRSIGSYKNTKRGLEVSY